MSLREQPDPCSVRIEEDEPPVGMSPAQEACQRLHALLREHVHDSYGDQVGVIIASACRKVFLAHTSRRQPVLELNGATMDLDSCRIIRINYGLNALRQGKSNYFPELIRLDPEVFFRECERKMEEKRVRSKPKESAQIPADIRAEILAATEASMSAPHHKDGISKRKIFTR